MSDKFYKERILRAFKHIVWLKKRSESLTPEVYS